MKYLPPSFLCCEHEWMMGIIKKIVTVHGFKGFPLKRDSGLFLASFHPCLEIYEPSTDPRSSLQTTEQAIEGTHIIAKKVLCQVRIGSLRGALGRS